MKTSPQGQCPDRAPKPRTLLAAAVWLLAASPISAQTPVRVAVWNIAGVGPPGSDEYQAALAVIHRLEPDVLGINEILGQGDLVNLEILAAEAGYGYVFAPPANPFGAMRNGVISRLPLTATPFHTSASLSGDPAANDMTRFIVQATAEPPGHTADLTIFVQHWKSGTGGTNNFRRAAESFRMGQAIAPLDSASDAFIVAGDVNEEIHTVPRLPNPITSLPPGLPLSFEPGQDLLAELTGPGLVNDPFHAIVSAPSPPLTVVRACQLTGHCGTRPDSGRRLDYIFVSAPIAAGRIAGEAYDSAHEHLPGGLPRPGPLPPPGASRTASDHLIIVADIVVPAACYADCNRSGTLDFFDFLCFQNAFIAADPYADCDGSGALDFFDFLCFQNEFLRGC